MRLDTRSRALLLVAAAGTACGAEDQTNVVPPGPPECVAGESRVPVEGCKAGIPPDACAEGFEADGTMGCNAILPAEPCEPGKIAIPGDTVCRDLVDCGAGTWGAIAVAADTQHVDPTYTGMASDGTPSQPWTTIGAAVAAAAPGAIVALAAGDYAEDVVLEGKAVTLWGRCPTMVAIAGSGAPLAAVEVRPGAGGSVVKGVAITGPMGGIFVSGADLTVENVWVHDTAARGIAAQEDLGEVTLTVLGSVVEAATDIGIHMVGGDLTVDGTAVRGTIEPTQYATGYGLAVQADPTDGDRGTAVVAGSVFEQNHTAALLVVGSSLELAAVVVRDTQPSDLSQRDGLGMIAQGADGVRATVDVKASVFSGSYSRGIAVVAADATLEHTHVHDTAPQAWDGNTGEGVAVIDSQGEQAFASVVRSTIERSHQSGIFVRGSSLELDHVLVRDTEPRGSDDAFGRGIAVVGVPEESLGADATIDACLVENSETFGIWIADADASIGSTLVRGTAVAGDGDFGHGVAAVVLDTATPTTVTFVGSRSESNAAAGLALYGSDGAIDQASFECNAEALLGESDYLDVMHAYTLDDRGGSACGCGSARTGCVVRER
jgi:hypothetical protein